jgi:hypothetical protein
MQDLVKTNCWDMRESGYAEMPNAGELGMGTLKKQKENRKRYKIIVFIYCPPTGFQGMIFPLGMTLS